MVAKKEDGTTPHFQVGVRGVIGQIGCGEMVRGVIGGWEEVPGEYVDFVWVMRF